jgi:hypothetical protein
MSSVQKPLPTAHVRDTRYGSVFVRERQMTTLAKALENVPAPVDAYYQLTASASGKQLTIDPRPFRGPKLRATGGVVVRPSENGGKILSLDKDRFAKAQWIETSLFELLRDKSHADVAKLEQHPMFQDLSAKRWFLVVEGARKDAHPIVLGFADSRSTPGLVEICNEVTTFDMDGRPGMIFMKKPVVYVYPEKKQIVSVQVEIDGPFVAQYPKMHEGAWRMIATPEGTLFDPTSEKRYSYLFWEGLSGKQFELDATQAFCVKGDEADTFLERVSVAYALNDKERTDFISYWVPALAQNNYNIIQFLTPEAYEKHARMIVAPKPDAVIRLFMIFKGAAEPVVVGAPELPSLRRGKFTVVEWGGANLDE